MTKEIYVVVCENPRDPAGELVLETYIRFSSLKEAQERKEHFEKSENLGKCRIAKLQFINEENNDNRN